MAYSITPYHSNLYIQCSYVLCTAFIVRGAIKPDRLHVREQTGQDSLTKVYHEGRIQMPQHVV